MKRIEDFEAHFWAGVDRSGGPNACWPWLRGRDKHGYGILGAIPGGSGRSNSAYRVAFLYANGSIPDGAHIRHSCDNPPCCNPAHLLAGTHADNMRDMAARKRQLHGERHLKAKLTMAQVAEARRLAGAVSHKELARRWGVSYGALFRAIVGKTWATCPEPPATNLGFRKLSREVADEIRVAYATGTVSVAELSMNYGASESSILAVIRNESYSDPTYAAPKIARGPWRKKAVA